MGSSTWLDISERVAGLVIAKKLSKTLVRPELFFPPYDSIIQSIKNEDAVEDTYLKFTEAYSTAIVASEDINGHHGNIDWVKMLEKSKISYESGETLSRVARNLTEGKDVSLDVIRDVINKFDQGKTGRKALSSIVPMEVPFIETGWEAYDEHLGGIPAVGLIVVSGYPGCGKTSWVIRLAKSFAIKHKTKVIEFVSLEMIDTEIALRFKEIAGSGKYKERILVNCDPMDVHEIINDAAQIENLGLLIVDFADLMVRGESSESSVGEIYRSLHNAAKRLNCPVVLLAQYSYKYQGGLPRSYHIRYTSLAQILGWMIICLWNPHTAPNFEEDKKALREVPLRSGGNEGVEAGAIVWKVRGGYRKHKFDSPGIIKHVFKGEQGWSPTGKWFHLKNY